MKRKLLSLVLTLAMLASLLAPAFAAQGASFTDTDGHWAQASVDRWAGAGVMNGTGSGFQPDKTMTRAEFAQMLVNLLGYTEKAENTFKDVPNDAWFADAVLKLAAAGVMQGDGVNANPNAEISRAEMAVLLCRALNIQPKASAGLSFADAASVPSWAEGAMAALAERGMISGVGGNQVAPTLSVNRASVAKLLDNVVGVYANEPGQVISGEVKGLVIVVADGVTLKDATVAENIVVAPKAGGASLTVTGKSTVADVYVAADGAKLTVDKDAAAGDILVDAAKAAVTVDGKADAVMTTESASAAALSVGGTVSSVSLAGADSQLKVSGTVKSVDVSATASGADVNVAKGGSIDTVKTSADDVKIAGEGTVKSVEVTAGSGVAVDTKGTEVTVGKNADSVTVDGKEVKPGETTGTTTGGGGGGGGGGGVTEYTVYYDDGSGNESYFLRQTVTAGGKTTAPSPAPTKEGYTFGGWYKDKACTAAWDFANDTVTSNVTLYAKWTENAPEPEKVYHISFNAMGGKLTNNKDIYTFEATVGYEKPADPVKTGYTFAGWYTTQDYQGKPASFPVKTEDLTDVTYYAKWDLIGWTVTFDGKNGSGGGISHVPDGGKITAPDPEPTKAGYSFGGWYKDEACTEAWDFASDTVTADITLYAKWVEALTQAVLGDWTTDRTEPQSWTISDGWISHTTTAQQAQNDWYDWQGRGASTGVEPSTRWTVDSRLDITDSMIAGTGVRTSLWIQVDSVSGIPDLQSGVLDWSILQFCNDPGNGGAAWQYWDSQNGLWKAIDAVTPIVGTHTLSTSYADGTITQSIDGKTVNSYAIDAGAEKLSSPAHLIVQSRTFGQSYTVRWEVPTVAYKPSGNTYHIVTFDAKGGTMNPAYLLKARVIGGTALDAPADPTRDGYSFGGWYKDEACTEAWDFANDTVTADITLYARWLKLVDVTNGLQAGLTAALADTDNSIFLIPAGTYHEQIKLDGAAVARPLTFLGQGKVTIDGPEDYSSITSLPAVAQESTPYSGIVMLSNFASPVTLDGINVTGNPAKASAVTALTHTTCYNLVTVLNASAVLENCVLDGPTYTDHLRGMQNGRAVYAVAESAKTLVIRGTEFKNFNKCAVLTRSNVALTMTGSTVTGAGSQDIIGQNGIQFSGDAVVTGNTITGLNYTGRNEWTNGSVGVYDVNSTGTVEVSGNTYANVDYPAYSETRTDGDFALDFKGDITVQMHTAGEGFAGATMYNWADYPSGGSWVAVAVNVNPAENKIDLNTLTSVSFSLLNASNQVVATWTQDEAQFKTWFESYKKYWENVDAKWFEAYFPASTVDGLVADGDKLVLTDDESTITVPSDFSSTAYPLSGLHAEVTFETTSADGVVDVYTTSYTPA